MSEYPHVEKPFLDQLANLGWTVVDQGHAIIPSQPAASLRTSFREWILPEVFKTSVRALNRTADGREWLTGRQLDDLRDQLIRHPARTLLEANEEVQRLLFVPRCPLRSARYRPARVKYRVSNNAFVVTFPNTTTNLITGDEYFYSTPDGSFVFGGSPQDFDMVVGVRTGTGTASGLTGLYYEAGMDADNSAAASGNVSIDTFYGAFNAASSNIIGHQRFQNGSGSALGYVYHDTYPVELGTTYTDLPRSRQFILGSGVRIGIGIGPFPGVTVAVRAPQVSTGSGMFLNPTSAINAASDAPFTTGISSGELITLTGLNLGPANVAFASTTPLPTTVAGVQVLLNNHAIPILSASATQITVQVPYQTTAATALLYVTYKGSQSNTISTLVNLTTPGVFTNPLGGVNRATARHANRSLVTPANPAKIGETVTVYLTGLGDLTTNVVDGGVGPTVTPAKPSHVFNIFVGGIAATPSLLALAPGLVGLYQMNIAIPAGVVSGDVFLDVSGPDSYSSQAIIAVTSDRFL